MKFAIISDIHGNLEALENVLRDIEKEGAEKIHFLGDAVGYGCSPNECVKLISEHCEIRLLGNHDYAALGLEAVENFNQMAQYSITWTQEKLTKKSSAILADFEMEADFLDYHLVHASPGEPEQWHYILTAGQSKAHFDKFSQSVCFVGHSHIPSIFSMDSEGEIMKSSKMELEKVADRRYIINVGSVGQPRDGDPRACYIIVDTETGKVYYRRVEYDVAAAQEKMKKANMPNFLVERIAIGH